MERDFVSILFICNEDRIKAETSLIPDFFIDLNLDQIVDTVTASKAEYNLKPFFYAALQEVAAITYRQEVMQDLEQQAVFDHIQAFAQNMRIMREYLAIAEKMYYKFQKERWFLDAVAIYCDNVLDLAQDLSQAELQSHGFLAFRDYLSSYSHSAQFTALFNKIKGISADLATVRYSLIVRGSTIKVRKYEGEMDYSADVEATFAKFKQGAVKDYLDKIHDYREMNHVEAKALDFVALLYPDIFQRLDHFYEENRQYLDEVIGFFDREIQFYLAYLDYIASMKWSGLNFCYPSLSDRNKALCSEDGFDLALANKQVFEKKPVIPNDFFLEGQERIIIVSGPNQGGKTTFARMFGQLHYLASLGLPIPGKKAQLFLFDRLFTHFEQEENIQNLRGKLEDDLVRIHAILDQATPNSIVIMNEIFTSTTLSDAVFLSREILERIIALDLLAVCVTFIDELASLEKTVSMVSTVVPEDPTTRTFKIVRRPADGLAYAMSIAEKYQLTYRLLKERLHG